MMNRFMAYLLLLLVNLGIIGCWDYRDINELALVSVAGLDRHRDRELLLLVELVRPAEVGGGEQDGGGGGAGRSPIRILETTGPTFHDAHRNLHFRSPREMFWGHGRALVIGEELAREGVAQVLDWYDRDEQTRRTNHILVTNGPARNIFQATPEIEETLGEEIELLIRRTGEQSQAYAPNLNEFLKTLSSRSQHPVAGRLELVQAEEPQEGFAGEPSGGVDPSREGEVPRAIRLAGLAVFKGDRLVGWLNERETRGFLWIIGEVEGAVIEVTSPGSPGSLLALATSRFTSTITPRVEGNQVSFQVEVEVQADLGEQQSPLEIGSERVPQLEAAAAAVIKQEMEDALSRAQGEYQVDIFGFGEELNRRFPKAWKKWEGQWGREFPTVPIEVDVELQLRHPGLVIPRVPVREK